MLQRGRGAELRAYPRSHKHYSHMDTITVALIAISIVLAIVIAISIAVALYENAHKD